ncbi:MAG: N-acetylmuramoyl-L-alanine amidase [Candidatus Melainabacteria bacterium]|nr:MAG: N-acetylmuramoyl-L-alanine amidase [Candidatus Melainabacteria bacterium]
MNKNRISNVKLSDNISKLSSFTVSNYNVDDKNLTFEFNNPCVFSFKRNSDKVEFVIYNGNFSDITKIKTTLTNSFGEAKVISYGHSIIKVILSIKPNAKTEFLETTNGKKATILIKNKMLKPQPIVIPKEDNIEETIKIPKNADKRLIVLDAGHNGGSDVGATRNGIYEKDINLDVTNRLARMLTKKGFKVVLTRKEDSTVSLQERVEISNAKRPVLFMSVHVNASVNETVRGVETHYWKDNSLKYANIVQKHLSTVDSPARGVVKSKFYVINHTEAPAVLVEIGLCYYLPEQEN